MQKFRNIALLFVLAMAGAVAVNAQAGGPDEKKFLVSDLVEATYGAFPADFFRKAAAEGVKTELGDLTKTIEEGLIRKIDADQEITAAQRAEAKSKAPAFAVVLAEKTMEIGLRGLDIDTWIKEALAYSYSKSMTTDELRQVKTFLDGPDGQTFLLVVREEANAEMEKRPSKSPEMLANADPVKVGAFIESPLGKKFIAVFDNDTKEYLDRKTSEWGSGIEGRIASEIKEGELARMMKEFKDSIVKPKP